MGRERTEQELNLESGFILQNQYLGNDSAFIPDEYRLILHNNLVFSEIMHRAKIAQTKVCLRSRRLILADCALQELISACASGELIVDEKIDFQPSQHKHA